MQDRWDLFKHSEFGEESAGVESFKSFDIDFIDFAKYETVYLIDVLARIKDYLEDEEEDEEDVIENFKEEVLEKWMKSFINYW